MTLVYEFVLTCVGQSLYEASHIATLPTHVLHVGANIHLTLLNILYYFSTAVKEKSVQNVTKA